MRKLFGFLVVGLVLLGFQNCGKVKFESTSDKVKSSGFAEGQPINDVVTDTPGGDNVIIVEDDVVVDDDKKDEEKDEDKTGDVADDYTEEDKKDEDKKDELSNEELDLYACGEAKEGKAEKKVLVCHYASGDLSKGKSLCIGLPALDAHLGHHADGEKDVLGMCPAEVAAQ